MFGEVKSFASDNDSMMHKEYKIQFSSLKMFS